MASERGLVDGSVVLRERVAPLFLDELAEPIEASLHELRADASPALSWGSAAGNIAGRLGEDVDERFVFAVGVSACGGLGVGAVGAPSPERRGLAGELVAVRA